MVKKPKRELRKLVLEKTTGQEGYSAEWGNMRILFLMDKKNGSEQVYIEGPLSVGPLLPRVSMVLGGE